MEVIDILKNEIDAARKKRDEYIPKWQRSIDERRGTEFETAADEGRSMVPMDWTITKTKAAQLASQLPEVRLIEKHAQFAAAVPVFATIVNDLMAQANVSAVIDECVVDVVNAAGIGACIVRYEALTEPTEVPAIDVKTLPPVAQLALATGKLQVPMKPATKTTDQRFCVDHIAIDDLLIPASFKLSDWDKAPWLGHTVRDPWPKAKRALGLKDEDKEKIIGAAAPTTGGVQRLNENGNARKPEDEIVEYDEVFYYRHFYHEDELYYDSIEKVVFVRGLDEPMTEAWTGQQFDEENGGYIGSCLNPIRVLTLNYVSGQAIPPSDSAIIRPMIVELQQSRQDMREQRKHSKPLRWVNVDALDPSMAPAIMDGTWNGMVPTIGPGDRAVGEISRAQYPRENHEMDGIYKRDIQEATSVGPNQAGQYASGERSASEAQIVQSSFQTEIGQQRAKVAAWVVGISQVLAGLFCLYGEVEETGIGASIGPDGLQRLQTWDRERINQKFVYDVRPDTMVRLEPQQEMQQIQALLNIGTQSGFVNPEKLYRRWIELAGFDPDSGVLVKPQPKGPEPAKVSYAFKAEDFVDPLVIAISQKSNPISPQEIEEAKMLQQARMMPAPPIPGATEGQHMQPGQVPPPATKNANPDEPTQNPESPKKAYPEHEAAPRIDKRRAGS